MIVVRRMGVPNYDRYHHIRSVMLHDERKLLYAIIEQADNLLAAMNSISDTNDPHTGAPLTEARKMEVYEACKTEYTRVMRMIRPDFVDSYVAAEARDKVEEAADATT